MQVRHSAEWLEAGTRSTCLTTWGNEVDLRECSGAEADCRAAVRLDNLIWPEYTQTVAMLRHERAARPRDLYWHEWLAEAEGQVVGRASYGAVRWSRRSGKFCIDIMVDPAWRNRGIGTAMYEHCLSRLQQDQGRNLRHLAAKARENRAQSIRFLEKRGFVQAQRWPISALDMAAFDETPFVSRVAQIRVHGFAIRTLAELARDCPDWQERYWQLDNTLKNDVSPYKPPSLEEYCRYAFGSSDFRMDAHWIAVQDGEWVGITQLRIVPGDRLRAYTGLTGVRRHARRRGVATALKLHTLRYARAHGFRTIITDNDENNPMFQINLALGFRTKPAWLGFRKAFRNKKE